MTLIGPEFSPEELMSQQEVVTDIMSNQDIPIPTQEIISNDKMNDIRKFMPETGNSVNFILLIFSFLFYFIGGYLLYASLFAAIGSAVDSETDTQQFMMPLTIPLIISLPINLFAIIVLFNLLPNRF